MPTVNEIIRRVLPKGTIPKGPLSWDKPPIWAPDLFGVTATLVNLSGCYSRSRYIAHWTDDCFFNDAYIAEVRKIGTAWGQGKDVPEIQPLWQSMLSDGFTEVNTEGASFCDAAVKLMSIADEACAGVGFFTPLEQSYLPDYIYFQHYKHVLARSKGPRHLDPVRDIPNLPWSLCWMIPPTELCVQPKARTPQVGCTLRSLSHHLALLPSIGEVKTSWLFATPTGHSSTEPLNLLLVPFPYKIDGSSFSADDATFGEDKNGRFFNLSQEWLRDKSKKLSAQSFAKFLLGLIEAATNEVRRVHGLVLPEAALDWSLAEGVSQRLARQSGLEIFVGGVFEKPARGQFAQNYVYAAIFHKGEVFHDWKQPKHHRWRLDNNQIRRYHLGDAVAPNRTWWEKIEIRPRQCTFHVYRPGSVLAALVCEDLARIDPAQVAVRSVGPNLLLVLLMDGPQLERRWPGKYATVLADDPGSAVLTLTSIGMARRAANPGEERPCQIALWKEPFSDARELKLPIGAHGLLLTISNSEEANYTLDGRSDQANTINLTLSGVRAIRHTGPPAWIDNG